MCWASSPGASANGSPARRRARQHVELVLAEAVAVTAVAPVAWGSTYVVTRGALPADAPVWGAAFRALPAGLLLLLLVRRLPAGAWWWRSVVLGALNVGGLFVLVYVAAVRLPSTR